jgi:hypothetical protein
MRFLWLFVIAGCNGAMSMPDLAPDLAVAVDLATARDFAMPEDLAMSDLETPTDFAGQCNAVANLAPVVTQTISGAAMPTPSGGVITPGTYYLTDSTVYAGGSTTPFKLQLTWQLSSTTIARAQSLNTGLTKRDSFTYTATGTTLSMTGTCGGSGNGNFGYDASIGDAATTTLRIYVPLASTVNTYTLQ